MTIRKQKVLLSWSLGRDSAWALHVLRQRDDLEVVGLLTSSRMALEGSPTDDRGIVKAEGEENASE
jgi:hypothetical protein